jgi:hypothetical protein
MRIARRAGMRRAKVALARKLAVVMHRMLADDKPRNLADRGWHAGPAYRDVAALFDQSRERLKPGGRLYVMVSSDSDLDLFGRLIVEAGFRARLAHERSIFIESLIIYELLAS